MSEFIKKTMKKWGIHTMYDFVIINIVFALAGMSIVFVRKPFFKFVGVTENTPFILKFFLWLLIVFPTYQVGLIVFGTLLGKFEFFWEKEKRMMKFFARLFQSKSNQNT